MPQATAQQQSIVEHGAQGTSMKVQALAGTGKTSTLIMLGHALQGRRGLYLAFNKSIATEAQRKFPAHIRASTVHSLAFRNVGIHYRDRIEGGDAGRLTPMRLVHHYRYASLDGVPALTRAGLVKNTLASYLNSIDPIPEARHVPQAELDRMALARKWSAADIAGVTTTLVQDTQRLWDDILDHNSGLPMTHDGYLRLFVDTDPDLGVDVLMLDEAQDASDLMVKLIMSQGAQTLLVGDSQQQIYSWRGAINIMERVGQQLHTEYLTQSFRFDNRIAGAANQVLTHLNSAVSLQGFEADRSALNSRAILHRTNAGVFGALMARGLGKEKQRAHVAGGVNDLRKMLDAVDQLQRGRATQHPDFIGFDNWDQVEDAADSYGAPAELRLVVKVVQKFPMRRLRQALDEASQVHEEDADLTLSTAHKAKGREWAHVGLGDDFALPEANPLTEDQPLNPEESRLNYVALTRPQRDLYNAKGMLKAYVSRNKADAELAAIADAPPAERVKVKMRYAPPPTADQEGFDRFQKCFDEEELEVIGDRLHALVEQGRREAQAPDKGAPSAPATRAKGGPSGPV